MRLKPLGDRIVIKIVEIEETTQSGIVLPDSVQEKPEIAEVLAIGSGITNDDEMKDEIEIGDNVIFSEYAGNKVKLDGEEYIVIKLADVLAVVE